MAETSTRLAEAPAAARFVLHAAEAARPALSAAYGTPLPSAINRAARTPAGHAALKLGPDEWLLLAPAAEAGRVEEALTEAAGAAAFSLVEVSDRNLGFELAGPDAALALNAGVPLDLAETAFPVGMATRTIFEKCEIVLWRTGADAFRIEIWRSFAPYLRELVEIAIRESRAAP